MTENDDQGVSSRALLEGFRQSSQKHVTELDVALLVAEVIDEQLDAQRVRSAVTELLNQAQAQGVMDLEGLLAFLRGQGFAQAPLAEVDLTHSSIDWLLQQQQGLPIVMAILIVTLAKGLGLDAYGINYPGYFLLRVQGEIVDPLALAVVPLAQLEKAQLKKPQLEKPQLEKPKTISLDELLVKANPVTLGFRMLNNLKSYYLTLGNLQATLATTDYQLAIAEGEPSLQGLLHFERGDYRRHLGLGDEALASYLECLRLSDDDSLKAQAAAHIQALTQDQNPTLH